MNQNKQYLKKYRQALTQNNRFQGFIAADNVYELAQIAKKLRMKRYGEAFIA